MNRRHDSKYEAPQQEQQEQAGSQPQTWRYGEIETEEKAEAKIP